MPAFAASTATEPSARPLVLAAPSRASLIVTPWISSRRSDWIRGDHGAGLASRAG
jgi:hypothetical protein